jgi:hypothetical protein
VNLVRSMEKEGKVVNSWDSEYFEWVALVGSTTSSLLTDPPFRA